MAPSLPAPDKVHPEKTPDRATLRRTKLIERQALPADAHQDFSQRIESHLEKLLHQHPFRVLGFYWPIRAEFDCRPLVTRLLSETPERQACLPVVSAPRCPLTFRAWTPDCALLTDAYGISFPAREEELIPDVLLIPVNAFDQQGYRLGYGSGYFDRTLASLHPSPLTIGIGFELARVASIAPESHDIPLDIIVTEAGSNISEAHTHPLHEHPIHKK